MLRPVAERTASVRPTRWEFWFRTQEASDNHLDSITLMHVPTKLGWFPFSVLLLTLIVVAATVWRKRRRTTR